MSSIIWKKLRGYPSAFPRSWTHLDQGSLKFVQFPVVPCRVTFWGYLYGWSSWRGIHWFFFKLSSHCILYKLLKAFLVMVVALSRCEGHFVGCGASTRRYEIYVGTAFTEFPEFGHKFEGKACSTNGASVKLPKRTT